MTPLAGATSAYWPLPTPSRGAVLCDAEPVALEPAEFVRYRAPKSKAGVPRLRCTSSRTPHYC
jgi:hypothetical protein